MNTKEREALGMKIRKAREAKKLTQGNLSSKVGQAHTVIALMERGELPVINSNLLKKIFEVLEIEPDHQQ